MKAAVLNNFKSDLEIKKIYIPKITDDEVLIKVTYAAVNPLDNLIKDGALNIITPYKLPLILGNELVGVITSIGKNVKEFKVGDRVYAMCEKAFAEYVAINHKYIAKVPEYLKDDEAACVPLASLTFLQAIKLMNAKNENSIFISGASGSFGNLALPLAKEFKIYASGNANFKQKALELGVCEYFTKSDDYTKIKVDFVIDCIGGNETFKQFKILNKGGKLVSLKGMPDMKFAKSLKLSKLKQILFYFAGLKLNNAAKKVGCEYHFMFVNKNGEELNQISSMLDNIKYRPSVGEIFSLNDINQALKSVKNNNKIGKVLINLNN
ncbi:NADP-dependent oxidoreductase [Campylobacter sp. RM12640]|uniref:NADP-dependent oxidoreductase n=1 Tax=unclassified Campylobacter TaxID=2593542 RepID=UPI0030142990|nr:NADP-dependent oxidoreductase [Campylobacter sp. RM12640]MBZ7989290.1 NADP-dependent oxidoreductase [Campylobacter sp. RM12635]